MSNYEILERDDEYIRDCIQHVSEMLDLHSCGKPIDKQTGA